MKNTLVIIFMYVLFIQEISLGQDICEPEKCYNDLKDAIDALKASNKIPTFKLPSLDEDKRIPDLIDNFNNKKTELEAHNNNFLNLIRDVDKISFNITGSLNDTEQFANLDKLNKVINDINNDLLSLEESKKNFTSFLNTCEFAKETSSELSKDYTRLILKETYLDIALKNIGNTHTQQRGKIVEDSNRINEDIDLLLKTSTIGVQYNCERLIKKINDTFDLITTNKDILKQLIEELINIFQINKLKQFVDNNEDDLRGHLKYLNDLKKGLDSSSLDKMQNKFFELEAIYTKATNEKLKMIRAEADKEIRRTEEFTNMLTSKIPYLRERIEILKKIKIIDDLNNEVSISYGKLVNINTLKDASCPIAYNYETGTSP